MPRMKSVATKRAAPAVAAINKRDALLNLERKILILKNWISAGIPHFEETESLVFYPKSVRQFNLWDGSQNPGKLDFEIKRNANDTLRGYPDLRTQVKEIVCTIQVRAEEQLQGNKKARIGKLLTELAIEKRLRQVVESELVEVRRILKSKESIHENQERRSGNRIEELKSEIERLSDINALLTKDNAKLIAESIKVKPIRRAGK